MKSILVLMMFLVLTTGCSTVGRQETTTTTIKTVGDGVCMPEQGLDYIVQVEDNLFSIAEQFGLHPETVLWANYDQLLDNPNALRAGLVIHILPVDGVYYEWQPGDEMDGVAARFGVTAEEIIRWPGNCLPRKVEGGRQILEIRPGERIIIPAGHRPIEEKFSARGGLYRKEKSKPSTDELQWTGLARSDERGP